MSQSGFVYVLMNVSMGDLVKIGRTDRDPEERAKELSASTGVPTPFIVVYEAFFKDSLAAEAHVHAALEAKGYRVSSTREFFNAPAKHAVASVVMAQQYFSSLELGHNDAEVAPSGEQGVEVKRQGIPETVTHAPWAETLELADRAYYGTEDEVKDVAQGLRLYRRAAKLGSSRACLQLGLHYKRLSDHKNYRSGHKDREMALLFLREGGRLGSGQCYAEMIGLVDGNDALKCWAKYFQSDDFLGRTHNVAEYGYRYVCSAEASWRDEPRDIPHLEAVVSMRDQIVGYLEEKVSKASGGNKFMRDELAGLKHRTFYIDAVLYPEGARDRRIGSVDPQRFGFARVRTPSAIKGHTEFPFAKVNQIDRSWVPQKGELVEFEVGGVEGLLIAAQVKPIEARSH